MPLEILWGPPSWIFVIMQIEKTGDCYLEIGLGVYTTLTNPLVIVWFGPHPVLTMASRSFGILADKTRCKLLGWKREQCPVSSIGMLIPWSFKRLIHTCKMWSQTQLLIKMQVQTVSFLLNSTLPVCCAVVTCHWVNKSRYQAYVNSNFHAGRETLFPLFCPTEVF